MKKAPEPAIKLKSRILPLVIGILVITQLALPHESWLTLLIGLGGVWLAAYLWVRALAQSLVFTRQMRFGWAQVGDQIEEQFILTNLAAVPALWVEIIDHSTMPTDSASQVRGVGNQSTSKWKLRRTCSQRGVFTLGPTTLRSGDPFGLYAVTIEHPDSVTLTVTPPVVPLPAIEVAPGGRVGEGRAHRHALEHTVSVDGVRPYLPGDSLRTIHWPTSARHNAFFVHQFQNTPASDWWILLDLAEAVQVGSGERSTLEHGIILAASLADRGLRAGRAVGLTAHGQELVWLPPRHGDTQRHQILRALAQAQVGPQSLARLLTQLPLKRAVSLIIITPTAGSDWVERLTPLRQRGVVPTVLLLDPVAFGGSGDSQALAALLTDWGISHHRITPDLLDRPESRPGQQGQWEWRVSPLGRAVAHQQPRDTTWHELGQAEGVPRS